MPNLIESSEFGLEDEKINKEVAFNLLSEEDQEVFENNDRYVFFKVGDFVSGKLACISKGNNDPYVSYYVEYETRKIKNIGSNVTGSHLASLWKIETNVHHEGHFLQDSAATMENNCI